MKFFKFIRDEIPFCINKISAQRTEIAKRSDNMPLANRKASNKTNNVALNHNLQLGIYVFRYYATQKKHIIINVNKIYIVKYLIF